MLTVCNYHYIRENFDAPFLSIFGVTPNLFEKQLLLLQEIGTFIHPNDLIHNIDEILQSKKNFILITFDDGLKEQIEIAKPILDKLGVPALFFINSINFIEKNVSLVHQTHLLRSIIEPSKLLRNFAKINSQYNFELTQSEQQKAVLHYNYDTVDNAFLKYILNFKLSVKEQSELINGVFRLYFDEKETAKTLYMTENQLIDLAKEGMLGSHTHSHLPLGLLTTEVILEELITTKNYLEKLTQHKIYCVSYPYGSEEACAKPVTELAFEIGHTLGFSMERGINTGNENKLLLKRFDCNDLIGGKNYKN